MSEQRFLVDTIGKLLRPAGFKKKSDSWYLSSEETISVINLQKSDFGKLYFVNIGVLLKCICKEDFPKEYKCHIRFRWTSLIPQDEKKLERLMDFNDEIISDADRLREISRLLEAFILPFFSSAKTLDGLRKLFKSNNWPVCLVNVKAQEVLRREV